MKIWVPCSFAAKAKNAGSKKTKTKIEDHIGNFVSFEKRSFYWEVRGMEYRKGHVESFVRALPDRETLIRVELKQFLVFITLGIIYKQPLNAFQDDQDRHQ